MSILRKKTATDESKAPDIRIRKSGKKKRIILIIVLILLVLIAIFAFRGCKSEPTANIQTKTATVIRDSLEITLSGSGTIEANEQREITALVKGDITSDFFEKNDIVKKDDPLYQFDVSDMETSIQKAEDALEKAQRNHNKNMKDMSKLIITSPVSGVVSETHVSKGDDVANGTPVLTVQDNTKMILNIEFNESDRSALYIGAPATVHLEGSATTYGGTVERISTGSVTNSRGATVMKVDIAVSGINTLTPGVSATAICNGVACNTAGTFDYNKVQIVKSEISGTVDVLNFKVGDSVRQGEVVAKLSSSSLEDALFDSKMSVQDAKLSLKNLQDTLEDYTIKAPIDGTVIEKNVKAGDKLDSSTATSAMAIIADMSVIKFTLAVDELDITKVKMNQKAIITADALENETFTGYVSEISSVGTTTNGVTTYPVTIIIDNPEGLIPGMNVEATIITQSAEDALLIPATALNRGNTVWVKADSKSAKNGKKVESKQKANDKSFEGYVQIEVETGLSNDSYVEITSGLSEGDEILITTVVVNSEFDPTKMMQGGMPGGGMPAGAPRGGMPGGGNRGNMGGGMR